jgi:hypothetical protein
MAAGKNVKVPGILRAGPQPASVIKPDGVMILENIYIN